jgi:malate/lactate dehydrogenase
MSRKVSVISAGEDGALVAFLLAERDYAEVVLVGSGGAEDIATAWGSDRVHHAAAEEETGGSDVLVLAGTPADDALRALARHSPDAVVIVAAEPVTEGCDRVLEVVSPPRGRVLGVPADGPFARAAGARALVDAVLLDRRRVLACVARCQGEHGLHGTLAVRARVGSAGVEEILSDAASVAPRAP